MDKHEKMNQIKEYISRIEEDLNTSVRSDIETITNKNILQCMKYISELLEETISKNQEEENFFITDEQCKQLCIYDNIPYPPNKPIYKFINENKNKHIIIASVGSCNIDSETGNYNSVIIYQNMHKTFYGELHTRSSNQCILRGLKEAVLSIKKSSDLIIITPTALGFNSSKSINYHLCMEIIDILKEKHCKTDIFTCTGKGTELRNYINLISKINKKLPD